jgi:hypothetical protein
MKFFVNRPLWLRLMLALMLLPIAIGGVWAGYEYISFRSALARWDPEKASIEAAHDIRAGKIKVYMHGTIAGLPVGVEEEDRHLIKGLPFAEAGVGCIVPSDDIYDAQGAYAVRYNQAIVKHLLEGARKG